MAVLFGKSRSTINEHINNIFEEGELIPDSEQLPMMEKSIVLIITTWTLLFLLVIVFNERKEHS